MTPKPLIPLNGIKLASFADQPHQRMLKMVSRLIVKWSAQLLLGLAVVVSPGLVNAALVSFNFSTPGSLFGTVSYDTNQGTADVLVGSVTSSGVTYSFAPQPSNISVLPGISVRNNIGAPLVDVIAFYIGVSGPNLVFGVDEWRPSYLILAFEGDAQLLSSTALPSDPLILNNFSSSYATLQFERLNVDGTGSGVTSGFGFGTPVTVSAVVPEPESLLLATSALLILGFSTRRR